MTLADVRRLPRDDWDQARVTDIMTRFGDIATVGPDDDGGENHGTTTTEAAIGGTSGIEGVVAIGPGQGAPLPGREHGAAHLHLIANQPRSQQESD